MIHVHQINFKAHIKPYKVVTTFKTKKSIAKNIKRCIMTYKRFNIKKSNYKIYVTNLLNLIKKYLIKIAFYFNNL